MGLRFLFVGLFLLLGTLRTALAQEGGSYLEAAIANAEAIRSFDVVGTYESVADIPGGRAETVQANFRFTIDYDERQFSHLYFGEKERIHTRSGDDEDSEKSIRTEGCVCTGGAITQRTWPAKAQQHAMVDLYARLFSLGAYDIRLLGLLEGIYDHSRVETESISDWIQEVRAHGRFAKISNATATNVLVSAMFETEDPSLEGGHVWLFDTDRLVPLSVKLIDGKKPVYTTNITWEEHNGVQLPKQVTNTCDHGTFVGDQPIWGTKSASLKLQWLSVNEGGNEELLDPALLDDIALCRKLCERENEESE